MFVFSQDCALLESAERAVIICPMGMSVKAQTFLAARENLCNSCLFLTHSLTTILWIQPVSKTNFWNRLYYIIYCVKQAIHDSVFFDQRVEQKNWPNSLVHTFEVDEGITSTGLLCIDSKKTSQPSEYTNHTFTLIAGSSDQATFFQQLGSSPYWTGWISVHVWITIKKSLQHNIM